MNVTRDDLRRWLFLTGGLFCLIAAFLVVLAFRGKFGADTKPARTAAELPEFAAAQAAQNPEDLRKAVWVVYVTGAVMSPGVYEVPENSRVNDAVKRAGGFSVHADPERINLAELLADGAHIKVPYAQDASGEQVSVPATGGAERTRAAARVTAPPVAESPQTQKRQGKININTCAEEDLQTLPGIGPVLSRSIIGHREKNGPFAGIDDIRSVSGIGAKRFEAIKGYIVVAD
jgi:competence protein ComEA